MKIVIVGAGGVGFSLCEHLMGSHDIVVIDKNEDAISKINSQLDVMAICGNAKNPKLFEGLDKNVDFFIAVTDSDDVNLLSSLMIDEVLNVDKKILRLENNFYNPQTIKDKLKINNIIFPAKETLSRVEKIAKNLHVQTIKTVENTNFSLNSFRLKNISKPISQEEIFENISNDIALCGIERDGEFFFPSSQDKLHENDLLYLLSYLDDVQIIGETYGQKYSKVESCIVFGADILGREIAKLLLEKNINVRVFEKELKLCKLAQEELGENVNIYHAKYGIDHHFQEDEMRNAQMAIATTKVDEYNLVKCIEAKQNGIQKVIAINNDMVYTSLMRNVNIDIIRGIKSSSFFSILEKIGDTTLVLTKQYCAGAACILTRQTYGLMGTTKVRDFSEKISKLGLFFIIRDEYILPIKDSSHIIAHDILLVCSKNENSSILTKWLQKQF